MKRFLSVILALCLAFSLAGQTSSPRINADGSVTFTFRSVDADRVRLKGDIEPEAFQEEAKFDKSFKLTEDDKGNWSLTVPPLKPDMYMYAFEVDGDEDNLKTDPGNSLKVRDVNTIYSAFIYPGGQADYFLQRSGIAHGSITHPWYTSTIKDQPRRRMTVYLPPSYDADTGRRYPVLYLLHGTGGDENAWTECGRAAQILDGMIQRGQIAPMIVVMPNCDASMDAAPGYGADKEAENNGNNLSSMFGRFESAFKEDIVRYVDSHYRTVSDKRHRAIAGLSLGGMQTLYTAANNPGLFDYIGLFSAQTEPYFSEKQMNRMEKAASTTSRFVEKLTKALPFLGDKMGRGADNFEANVANLDIYKDKEQKMDDLFAQRPRLFYIACGKDDQLVKGMNDELRESLSKGGHDFVYNESDGGHTWSNWRFYLLDFLPRLWK